MKRLSRSTPKGRLLPKGRKNHKKGRPPPGGMSVGGLGRREKGSARLSEDSDSENEDWKSLSEGSDGENEHRKSLSEASDDENERSAGVVGGLGRQE